MLTNEEKLRIELEEKYRKEIQDKFRPKSKLDVFGTVMKILQAAAIIAGIWATYFQYKKQNDDRLLQQKKDSEARIALEKQNYEQTAKEFRKGFYAKQFELYGEASEAAAILATEKIGTEDYLKAKQKFYRLFWGQLSMVEDATVETQMMNFDMLLTEYENDNGVTQQQMKDASLDLAHAASKYTITVWLDTTERKNYNR